MLWDTGIVCIYKEDIMRITVLNGSPKGEQNVSSSWGAVQRLTIARVRMDSGRLI